MFAMSAHRGHNLTSNEIANSFLEDCLDELQLQGGSTDSHPYWNEHGWSLTYYLDGDMFYDYLERETEEADDPPGVENPYDDEQVIVQGADAHLALGHVRRSTNITGIPDPHPFIFHTTNADYAFMHNGSVDSVAFRTRIDLLDEDWLDEYPITYYEGDYHYVDSEFLFSWIMLNIHLNNYNIFEGLLDAIQGMGGLQEEDRTFILTDGIDLYCYKNSTDADDIDHDLHYTWNTVEISEYGLNFNFWTVMSLFPSDLQLPFIETTAMVNDELLYLSSTGAKVSIRNCSGTGDGIEHNRQLSKGWNWEAFPIFPTDTNNGADILDYLETHGGITEVIGQHIGNPAFDGVNWIPPTFPFNDKSMYKLNMTDGTLFVHQPSCFHTIGNMRDSSLPLIEIVQGYQYYWIAYDLMPSQRIDDAFGNDWSNVRSIKGDDWAFSRQERGEEPDVPVWSPKGKYLEFGKGYIVSFFDDMSSFKWTYRHNFFSNTSNEKEAETFIFETKSDYLPIDILDCDVTGENLEIGAYQDGFCIGAVGVNDFPVQLKAYSDINGGPISFEIHDGERATLNIKNYQVMDIHTGNMDDGIIVPRGIEYAIITIGNTEFEDNDNFDIITINNYPNPFNPVTKLSFSLPVEAAIEISIYNLKGQKVKTIAKGEFTAGTQQVTWDGNDNNNKQVSSGIYMYRLETSNKVVSRKMILMR